MKNIHFQATLKKYQSERKSKAESIERCQSQLKKLRRKSQGSRHPNKYGDREMQVLYMQCIVGPPSFWIWILIKQHKVAFPDDNDRWQFLPSIKIESSCNSLVTDPNSKKNPRSVLRCIENEGQEFSIHLPERDMVTGTGPIFALNLNVDDSLHLCFPPDEGSALSPQMYYFYSMC